MSVVTVTGTKITVTTDHGVLVYAIKKVQITYSIVREDGSVLVGGRLNKADCIKWIKSYYGVRT